MDKAEVIRTLQFGNQIAEEERDALQAYFVKTRSWQRVFNGDIDVVYGPKGAGKSAIYLLILEHRDELFDQSILLVNAENVRGTPNFREITLDPPTSEREFIQIWKLYFLTIIGRTLLDFEFDSVYSKAVVDALVNAELIENRETGLASILKSVRAYIKKYINPEGIETTLHVDPTSGLMSGVTGRILFREPSADERRKGFQSVDELLATADRALEHAVFSVWILLDRLDVAFDENVNLERNALRALFKAYGDIRSNERIILKIFLRTDIWDRISEEGFREATHISKDIRLRWDRPALLNLIVRRLINNDNVVKYYNIDVKGILEDANKQESFFYRLFPEQIRAGEKQSTTLDWILKRTSDGSGENAPREIIILINNAIEVQNLRLERGEEIPSGDMLFDRGTFEEALPGLSEYKVTKVIYAEYPDLRKFVMGLEGEKTEHTIASLAEIWKVDEATAAVVADKLVKVGFFERRGQKDSPTFWVPFIFRPHLGLVQGLSE